MEKPVTLKQYNPMWKEDFLENKKMIIDVIGEKVVKIEHIGSTSIPNMIAKPIIDIGVTVKDLADVNEEVIKKLNEIGFTYVPKEDFPNRLFFRKGEFGAGTHHLHIYKDGSKEWNDIIFFRNYLIDNQEAAEEYKKLKRYLVSVVNDRKMYTRLKEPFILSILKKRVQ